METIRVSMGILLHIRRTKDLPIYSNKQGEYYQFFVQAEAGILLEGRATAAEAAGILPFVNMPVLNYDRRFISHNFVDNTTWSATDDSSFIIAPDTNEKVTIFTIEVRFPKTSKLTATNKLVYAVYKSYDGVNPVTEQHFPVLSLEYESVADLLRKTDNLIGKELTGVPNAYDKDMISAIFHYSDPHNVQAGAPLVLRSALGEYVKVYLADNTPILDVDDAPLTGSECYVICHSRRTTDF